MAAHVVFKKGPSPKPKQSDGKCHACWAMGTNPSYNPNANDIPDAGKLATWQKVLLGIVGVVALAVAAAPVAVELGGGFLASAPVCAAEISEVISGGASGGSALVGTTAASVGAKVLTAGRALSEEPATLYGPFHRLFSEKTQTPEVARNMVESGELWGTYSRFGGEPMAQAHLGPLPKDAKPGSVEFYTTVQPKSSSVTKYASWEAGTAEGVEEFTLNGVDYAKIPVIITEVR